MSLLNSKPFFETVNGFFGRLFVKIGTLEFKCFIFDHFVTVIFFECLEQDSGVAILSMDELRKVRADIEKGNKGATREAALLTQSEI